ncbi:MAG: adenylyltransferase/cytidyltransferase family protein [Candidatus Heimdallarchaeota archaeon]|nr:MAG: adenylyltransferase/cytidyltransferase family protein [Candidatus Heimdallarchaeota archaeon]
MLLGYTTGVFDLFHTGHVNFLKAAKNFCDRLVVGVTTDELAKEEKNKTPIISLENRMAVLSACKYVDLAIPHNNSDKILVWNKLKFDVLIIGDDWYNSESYNYFEEQLKEKGVKVIYIPYTEGISASSIQERVLQNKGF